MPSESVIHLTFPKCSFLGGCVFGPFLPPVLHTFPWSAWVLCLSYKLKDLLQLFAPFTSPVSPAVTIACLCSDFLWLVSFILSASWYLTVRSVISLFRAVVSHRCHLSCHEGVNNESVQRKLLSWVSEVNTLTQSWYQFISSVSVIFGDREGVCNQWL